MKFKRMVNILGMEMWGASTGKFSFLITYGIRGYDASYKDREFLGKQSSHHIEGSPFQSFKEAELACHAAWKKLRLN